MLNPKIIHHFTKELFITKIVCGRKCISERLSHKTRYMCILHVIQTRMSRLVIIDWWLNGYTCTSLLAKKYLAIHFLFTLINYNSAMLSQNYFSGQHIYLFLDSIYIISNSHVTKHKKFESVQEYMYILYIILIQYFSSWII